MTEMNSNAADVKAEIERVLEEVEGTLSDILSSIRKLDDESQQAKAEITRAVSRQLTHLHSRQTQLLRQVDVICHARGELLHDQLAHCYRLLGALQTQKWADKLQQHKSAITVPVMAGMKKSNPLNWTLNEAALSSAIDGFGQVDMDGILLMGTGEQSKCLPAKFEDYFEDDQHVMEKSLSSSNVIDMRFPKRPKDYSYWLSCKKQSEEKSVINESTYGPYRKALDSYKPCDVQTWLGCIQTDTAAEPMEDQDQESSIPELVSLSDTFSTGSSIKSRSPSDGSIEIVSSSALCSNLMEGSSCKQSLTDLEIENLADNFSHCKTDKMRWLAPTRNVMADIPVARACRANEICLSFDDCACQMNCHDVAHRNRDQKQQQEMNRWIRPSSQSSATHSPSHVPTATRIFPAILTQADASLWLKPKTAPSIAASTSHKIKDTANRQLKNLHPLAPALSSAMALGPWLRRSSNNLNKGLVSQQDVVQALNQLKLIKSSCGKVQQQRNIQDHSHWAQWLQTKRA